MSVTDVKRWSYHYVWAVFFSVWLTLVISRISLSPVLIPIIHDFNLDHAQAGLLASAYFYGYGAMQFPGGYLGDVFGRKRVVMAAAWIWAAIALVTGYSATFIQLLLLRVALGLSHGAVFGNDRAIVATSTPVKRAGLGQGLSLSGAGIGLAVGILLSGFIAETVSWRFSFILLALPGFVVGFVVWKYIREPQKSSLEPTSAHRRIGLSFILRTRALWFLYGSAFASGYTFWVLATWGPAIFLELGSSDLSAASLYAALMGVCGVPGLALYGGLWDSARAEKRRHLLLACAYFPLAAALWLMAVAVQGSLGLEVVLGLFVASAFLVWGTWALIYSTISKVASAATFGTAFGFVNFMATIGSMSSPWVTGIVRDSTGSFAYSLFVAAVVAVVGGLCTLMIRSSK